MIADAAAGSATPNGGMTALMHLVAERTGLAFPASRRESMEAVIRRATARRAGGDPERYAAILTRDAAAFDELAAELTVGETYFFREPGQFDFIRCEAVPDILRRRGHGHCIRAWSAGCASGEEAYSLAITLQEAAPGSRVQVVGTDLARARLAVARHGRYSTWSLRGVPERVLGEYFVRRGAQVEVAARVRDAVEFRYLNLAEDGYTSRDDVRVSGMDLILCRNVLIYLDARTVTRVARRLLESLHDDGWLFAGASDPPLAELLQCEVVFTGAGIAYRKTAPLARSASARLIPVRVPSVMPDVTSQPMSDAVRGDPELDYAPAAPTVPEHRGADGAGELARCYAGRDYARVTELAVRHLERDATDPAVWCLLVRALANQGELAAAGDACARGLERHRTSAELTYLYAMLLIERGHHRAAAATARQALYLDREAILAHIVLGTALSRAGDPSAARRALETAERLLAAMPPADSVPWSDGEPAGRLTELVRVRLALLRQEA